MRLLEHLQLLFVPAGVGVVAYASTLRDQALPLGLAVVVSWLAGLATVAWTLTVVARLLGARAPARRGRAPVSETWEWVRTSPIFLLALTVGAYQAGCWLRERTGGHPLAQPVLVAVVAVAAGITLLDVDYGVYRDATELIAFWLGPATVALAIPLHRQWHRLRGLVVPLAVAVCLGAVVSVTSAALIVRAAGGGDLLARTAAPKATTTPVAIALADGLGGIAPLAAVLAILAGILGAVAGPAVLDLLRVRDPRARGIALGSVSHGIGTGRLLHDDETQGAFSGLAMGLTALATSALMPVLALVVFA